MDTAFCSAHGRAAELAGPVAHPSDTASAHMQPADDEYYGACIPGSSSSSSSSSAESVALKKAETAGSRAGETSTACPSEASLPDDEDDHRHDALLATISEAFQDEEEERIDAPLKGGVTTIELAVASGNPGAVATLLGALDKPSAATQLTGCYGGRYFGGRGAQWDADDNGLVSMTNPFLHAARAGSTAVFAAVVSAMRGRLRIQQVKVAMLAKDAKRRSVLALALASKKKEMFEAALDAVESALTPSEVKAMTTATGEDGGSVLHRAADTGHEDIFDAVLEALRSRLTREEVKELMFPSGDGADGARRTALHSAAASGSKGTFDAVLEGMRTYASPGEVRAAMVAVEKGTQQSILHAAITSGSVGAFEGVLDAARKHLAGHEVKRFMSDDPSVWFGWSMHLAASCQTTGMFPAVLAALEQELGFEEVKPMMMSTAKYHGNLLHSAIESGRREVFDAVLEAANRRLSPQQVTRMLTMSTTIHGTILHSAVASGGEGVFKAVLSAVKEGHTPEQVRAMMRYRRERSVVTLLHSAAANGRGKCLFEQVLGALELELTPDEVKAMMRSTREAGGGGAGEGGKATILHSAVNSRSEDTFNAVLAALRGRLTREEVREMMVSTVAGDENILHCAAKSGMKGVFEAVLAALAEQLTREEVRHLMISSKNGALDALLEHTARSGSVELWRTVMEQVSRRLPAEQAGGRMEFDGDLSGRLLRMVAFQGNVGMWNAVLEELLPTKVLELLCSEGGQQAPGTAIWAAATSRDPATLRAVLHCVRRTLSAKEASSVEFGGFIASGFSGCTAMVLESPGEEATALDAGGRGGGGGGDGGLGWAIEVYSTLLGHPALLDPEELVQLSRKKSGEWLRACFLETVVRADNPFVPGMTLSVGLGRAAPRAPEGERRKLCSLQREIDALLLEVLDRLPQTVPAFRGGMAGCCRVFEPECAASRADESRGFLGPLWMALQERHQVETFLTRPLLLDFLSRRFTHGLPDPMDSKNVLRDQVELESLAGGGGRRQQRLYEHTSVEDDLDHHCRRGEEEDQRRRSEDEDRSSGCLLLDFHDKISTPAPSLLLGKGKILDTVLSPCVLLQGANYRCFGLPSLSLSRGTQFIFAGLAAMPDQYYRVPVMRLLLDLLVYLGMLTIFSLSVLFHGDGALTGGEIFFAFYTLAGAITARREMRRCWDALDVLGLGLVAAGLVVRSVDGANPWGRAFYAMSAPILFARLLFFAQFLRTCGPTIQVFLTVMGESAKFSVVLVVVMLGFAMSFLSLFNAENFGATCLHLFKGLFGDVGFLDEFPGSDYDAVATFVFVAFLLTVTIILINLLAAVIGTWQSRIKEKADQEFKVSKALLIDHYRAVVDRHLLPPPFNLGQVLVVLLSFLFAQPREPSRRAAIRSRGKQAIGRLAFWLVLGPVAVVGGALLWLMSATSAPFVWRRHYYRTVSEVNDGAVRLSRGSLALRYVVIFAWCVVGAPILLLALWLTAPLKWLDLEPWRWIWHRRYPLSVSTRRPRPMTVNEMLKTSSGGLAVSTIQTHVEDPMSDPEVREDDKIDPATVRHVKLLRDGLDARLDRLQRDMRGNIRTELKICMAELEKKGLGAGIRAGVCCGGDHLTRALEERALALEERKQQEKALRDLWQDAILAKDGGYGGQEEVQAAYDEYKKVVKENIISGNNVGDSTECF